MSVMLEQFEDTARRRLSIFPSWLTDYSSFDQSSDEDMSTIGWTLVVSGLVGLLMLLSFAVHRMYDPERFTPLIKLLGKDKVAKPLSNNDLYSWIYELVTIDDDTILQKGGYDTLSFIRFYRFNFRLFLAFAVYAWCVLLPVNRNGGGYEEDNSFEVWSMANISQGSGLCWLHLLGIYLLTGVTVWMLESEYVHYAKMRHKYLSNEGPNLRTVLVEGIPHKMRTNITLSTYFQTLYPGSVQSVSLAQNLGVLTQLMEERMEALRELETHLYKYKNDGKRRTLKIVRNGREESVEAIKHFRRLVIELSMQIAKEQKEHKKFSSARGNVSSDEAVHVIENLLRVTGLGVVKRLLTKNHNDKDYGTTGAGDDEMEGVGEEGVRPTSPSGGASTGGGSTMSGATVPLGGGYGATDDKSLPSLGKTGELETMDDSSFSLVAGSSTYDELVKEFSDFGDDDRSDDGWFLGTSRPLPPATQRRRVEIYKRSWSSWWTAMGEARSWAESWRIFRDGRYVFEEVSPDDEEFGMNGEGGGAEDREDTRLIRPFDERNRYYPKAFVTFKTFIAATTARQVIHMQLAGHLSVREAPEPRDVYWHNLDRSRKGTMVRRIIADIAVIFLIIFWVVPVCAISYFTNSSALESYADWISTAATKSAVFESTLELVQPLMIVGLMQILPPLFMAIGHYEGMISISSNMFKAFNRYFLFQVVNVFLVSAIAGSILDSLTEIVDNPSTAFTLLGESLPSMGGYFCNYILVKTFIGLGMEIMRLPSIFMQIGKYMFSSNLTMRERKEFVLGGGLRLMSNPGWLPYNKIYAQDALVTVLCASFANVAPLLLFPGLLYFACAGYIYTHQMLYVYQPMYETGGRWWPTVAACTVTALIFAQSTMIGMMILKETYTEIYFLIAIIVYTVWYYYNTMANYAVLATHLPFDQATSMDLNKPYGDEVAGHEYVQPGLREEATWIEPLTEFPLDAEDVLMKPPATPEVESDNESGGARAAGAAGAEDEDPVVEEV